ncbi:MAG: F0F1 ATP synthase subunit C [Rhodospirillales bacterium]|nr:F0F1 ATP synthase subunit C [Rhodospirillales bacterium]
MSDNGVKLLATALALLPMLAVALALGRIFSEWLAGVARNPGASDKMQQVGYLAFALTEAIALFALIVAFIILFVG